MKKIMHHLSVVFLFSISLPYTFAETESESIAQGKEIAFDRTKGNCLACHVIEDGELPGVLGPPLVGMKARYPDKSKLREQIWDASIRNPATSMPPFGKHRMLTEKEINMVVEYINSL